VHLDGRPSQTPIYEWSGLRAGQRVGGPAVVESAFTTVVVPAGMSALVDRFGNLAIDAKGSAS